MKLAAVLILNYNGKKYLSNCVDSILKQSIDTIDTSYKIDLFIIDDHSDDGSLEEALIKYKGIKYFKLYKNLGFAGACNFVIDHLIDDYKYFIILNNDTVARENWLINLLSFINDSPENIGVLNSLVINSKVNLVESAGTYFSNFFAGTILGFYSHQNSENVFKQPFEVFGGGGNCLLIRSSLIKKIKLFDSDYSFYFEDFDFCWRVIKCGYRIFCVPNSVIYHTGGGSNIPNFKKNYLVERNRIYSYYKNLSGFSFYIILPILVLFRFFSFLFFFESYQVFISKLKGVLNGIISHRSFKEKKREILKNTKLSDFNILKKNSDILKAINYRKNNIKFFINFKKKYC